MTEHPGMGLTDAYAAVIPDFPCHAGIHVHCQEKKLRIKDGLPKMKDVPQEMGGSGVSVEEYRASCAGRVIPIGVTLNVRQRCRGTRAGDRDC